MTCVKSYVIQKSLRVPQGREVRRNQLAHLVQLANDMNYGDAVALRLSEANQLRIILVAQGHDCVTDGYRCTERGKTLAFKVRKNRQPDLSYDI